MASIAILGGGIAGLTAAYRLRQHGLDVTVFESASRPGGVIQSEQAEGFLVEYGPHSLRCRTPLLDKVIADLALAESVIKAAPEANKRYVVRRGKLMRFPTAPSQLITTPALSLRGKVRLLAEPFIAAYDAQKEESVADFVRRRVGSDVLNYAASPFVSGIFAGDPERLSLRYAFPTLFEMEQQHGSLFKALRHSELANKQAPSLFSFRNGLRTLPFALAEHLGDAVRLDTKVAGLQRQGGSWMVTTAHDNTVRRQRYDAVLSTLPLHQFTELSFRSNRNLTPLAGVVYPPVTVIALGFRRGDVAHPLDGFGVLIPESEVRFETLGVLFSSTVFPGRAPEECVLLTALLGGTRHPDSATASPQDREATVLRDLQALLDVTNKPFFSRQWHWPRAIPQYNLGYKAVYDLLNDLEDGHRGLYFGGNYRHGISVGDAMASGNTAALRLIEDFA